MKKLLLVLCLLILMMSGCSKKKDSGSSSSSSGSGAVDDGKLTIGVLVLMEHQALDDATQGAIDYLRAQGYDEKKLEIIVKYAQGDVSTAATIANQFVEDDVDLIYAIATPAAQAAVNATKGTDIPVVFNAVTDAVAAELVTSNEHPGGNVTGMSDEAPIDLQLALIVEILPDAKKIGMIQNTSEVNSQVQIDIVKSLAPSYGLEVIVKGVSSGSEISTAASQLVEEVDAIYNVTDNLVVSNTATIVNAANKAGIPVFAAEDSQFDQGILAAESISYYGLGTSAGEIIEKILYEGADPGSIPVKTATITTLSVNTEVADLLGIELPISILNKIPSK
ncbi:MAG: ABC transporter substrate-binding protein [Erysipelotrichaceae bacterium]|nr:ABC transporter substrate-binding protein [Erysipelotrichaceae bacterium]